MRMTPATWTNVLAFAEPRGFEAAKAGHHIYRTGDGDDGDVAADDGGGAPRTAPEDDGRCRAFRDREHYKGRRHQQLVGDRIEDGAELGFLLHRRAMKPSIPSETPAIVKRMSAQPSR